MRKRIVVIGATGLLGDPVARLLKQSGYLVRLMIRDIKKAANRFGDEFEVVEGNVQDTASLAKVLADC